MWISNSIRAATLSSPLIILTFIASAQEKKHIYDWTGNDWTQNYTDESSMGSLAAMKLVGDIFIMHAKDANICPTKGSNLGQATAIANKYIKAHPEYWHLNAMTLIATALREVFPCSKN